MVLQTIRIVPFCLLAALVTPSTALSQYYPTQPAPTQNTWPWPATQTAASYQPVYNAPAQANTGTMAPADPRYSALPAVSAPPATGSATSPVQVAARNGCCPQSQQQYYHQHQMQQTQQMQQPQMANPQQGGPGAGQGAAGGPGFAPYGEANTPMVDQYGPATGGEQYGSSYSSYPSTGGACSGSGYGAGYGSGYSSGYGGGCDGYGGYGRLGASARACSPWYASGAVLYMSRDDANRVWTTYETNNNPNQIMYPPGTDWEVGAEVRIGRYFQCGCWAVELGYWTLDNFNSYSSMTHANTVSSPLAFNDLEFGAGSGDMVADYFNSAEEHRIWRDNEIHNIEVNFVQSNLTDPCNAGCRRWSGRVMFGLRYFKFDEDLVFASLDQGGTWGGNGGLDEAYLESSVENNLLGFQLGWILERQIGSKTQFFVTPKIGVYNNQIDNYFNLYRGDGTVASPTAFSGVSGSYPVRSSTDVVSFMTEIDLGLRYQATERLSFFGGWRVVAITGVALADEQIPQYIVDIPEIADIDTNGDLVLQGAFLGAALRY